MKKIAILTQPLIANYGGILQNFALQFKLKQLGYDPITVNRIGNRQSSFRLFLSWLKNATYYKIKGINRRIFSVEEMNFITNNAKQFVKNNIHVSDDINSTLGLKKYFLQNTFDTVIIGSDQTWRPSMSADIYNYFLDFLDNEFPINKIAFSSSFGTDDWEFDEQQTALCKHLIQQFSNVSVREKSGIQLCNDYLGKQVVCTLDPTLLLKKEDYIPLFIDDVQSQRKGLFTYVLDQSEYKSKIIKEVSDTLYLPIYNNQPAKDFYKDRSNDINDFVYPKIENWIKSFYEADFVITDSFHGTVFSILFNKPFLVLMNKERGAARFYSLLNALGLENRLITEINPYSDEILKSKIDFETINNKLDLLRKESILYLKNSIELN